MCRYPQCASGTAPSWTRRKQNRPGSGLGRGAAAAEAVVDPQLQSGLGCGPSRVSRDRPLHRRQPDRRWGWGAQGRSSQWGAAGGVSFQDQHSCQLRLEDPEGTTASTTGGPAARLTSFPRCCGLIVSPLKHGRRAESQRVERVTCWRLPDPSRSSGWELLSEPPARCGSPCPACLP